MSIVFRVLASGSSGNSSLLRCGDNSLLLDFGLGCRQLQERMRDSQVDWPDLQAVLLTHTHSDHWRETSLARLAEHGVTLWCHAEHIAHLDERSTAFRRLADEGLVETFVDGQPIEPLPDLYCLPFEISHDAGATFGFRFAGGLPGESQTWAIGYAADLGCWNDAVRTALSDVDLLALEFNHDVERQWASGRPDFLIERILSDEGHLSNEQAGELLRQILDASEPGRIKQLVQLHLSREANEPRLARSAAQSAWQGWHAAQAKSNRPAGQLAIHTATQDQPTPPFVRAPRCIPVVGQ